MKRQLKYINHSFPTLEWNDFLKDCHVDFRTSRKDGLWNCIRGRGFLIWISWFYSSRENGQTTWFSNIEMNENAPQAGRDALEELIHGALTKFEKMELVDME